MLRLNAEITIDGLTFREVESFSINSTWERFTDTATITLPQRIEFADFQIARGNTAQFLVGNRVEIKAGYFPNLETVFVGYVSRVRPELPVVIECQDVTWLLKQVGVQMSFATATLKQIIEEGIKQAAADTDDIVREEQIQAINTFYIDADMTMGSFRTVGGPVNFVGILQEIKKTYGLVSFAQDDNLFVGSPYLLTGREVKNQEIIFERNVIEHDLDYQNKDDVKMKVNAIAMLPDNTKIEVTVGDAGGETRTFFTYNEGTDPVDRIESALKITAEAELDRFKFEGYRGSFVTFGEPRIRHGDSITLINKKIPERDGVYRIDSVDTEYGQNGFRQSCKLGAFIGAVGSEPIEDNNDKLNELITQT